MSHESFLQSILATPADDLPRLVYADWLDEHGDPERAEFIRVQCELARLPEADPRREGLEDREHVLLDENEGQWFGSWRLPQQALNEWVWQRGFIASIAPSASNDGPGQGLFDNHPIVGWRDPQRTAGHMIAYPLDYLSREWKGRIKTLDLTGCVRTPDYLNSLFESNEFTSLCKLDLSNVPGLTALAGILSHNSLNRQLRSLAFGGRTGVNFRWADAENETLDIDAFIAAISEAPLEELAAFDCGLTTDALKKLLAASFAPRLKSLDISSNPIAPDAWRAFCDAAPSMRLKRLDVSGTPLAGISLEPMLDSQSLEDLEILEMNRSGSARVNLEVLARSKFWTQASQLRSYGGTIPAALLEPLCTSKGPPALRLLDLADNYLRTAGVKLLCEAPWAGTLTCLVLSGNYLDDESLTVLADSGRFNYLRTLHLAHNNLDQDKTEGEVITDSGIRRLAATPSLARLRVLTLGYTGITNRSVDVLLNAPHWQLSGLGLDGCGLSADAIRILAESPRLARLNWLSLANNPGLSTDVLRPLAESPYLSRLCKLDVGDVYVGESTREALRERLGPRLST